jgi:hypothetical protein
MAKPLSQNARLGSFKLDLDEVIYSTDDEFSPEVLVPQEVLAAAAAGGSQDIPGESAAQASRNGFCCCFHVFDGIYTHIWTAAGSAVRVRGLQGCWPVLLSLHLPCLHASCVPSRISLAV